MNPATRRAIYWRKWRLGSKSGILIFIVIATTMASGCSQLVTKVAWRNSTGLMKAAESIHGTADTPFGLVSFNKLRPYPDMVQNKKERSEFTSIEKSQYKTWQWRIDAKGYKNSNVHNRCKAFDWNRGLRAAYHLVEYLEGRQPMPMLFVIHLVPYGRFYRDVKGNFFSSTPTVEFSFWNYASAKNLSCSQRHKSFTRVIATVVHEVQHLENTREEAPGKVGRKKAGIKGEATSTCWGKSAYIALPDKVPRQIRVWEYGGFGLGIDNLSVVNHLFGGKPTAYPWATILINHDLFHYLTSIGLYGDKGEVASQKNYITIDSSDVSAVNAVLAYCRGFTRYDGDITTTAMPVSEVSRVKFLPSSP